jgi:hypothetical protein
MDFEKRRLVCRALNRADAAAGGAGAGRRAGAAQSAESEMIDAIRHHPIVQAISENPLLLFLFYSVGGVIALAWLFLLLDCLIRNFERHGLITGKPHVDKLIWIAVCLTVIGAVVYYFKVRKNAPHI